MTHEGSVAGRAESRDIGHHVIRAGRNKTFESSTLQAGDEVVAARGVHCGEVAVVVGRRDSSAKRIESECMCTQGRGRFCGAAYVGVPSGSGRSEEHTSELQ